MAHLSSNSSSIENDPTKNWQNTILFYVNGERYEITKPNPNTTLANYLRKKLHLTGTKVACGEGGCGACTVLISHYDHSTNFVVNRSVNACLFPLIQVDGCAIVTVEGIGNNHSEDVLHLIQQRFREFGASQCGFCTPGFVMSLYSLLRNNPHPSLEEISRAFDGNLCRCTGYRSIFEAAATFARVHEDSEYQPKKSGGDCGMGENCCQVKKNDSQSDCGGNSSPTSPTCTSKDACCGGGNTNNDKCCKSVSSSSSSKPTAESDQHSRSNIVGKHLYNLVGQKHPLFPHELRRYNPNERSLCVESPVQSGSDRHETKTIYYRPSNLNEFLYLRKKYEHEKHLRIICGNTELGIETKFKKFDHYRYYIEAVRIPELLVKKVNYDNNLNDNNNNNRIAKSIELGASLTLSNLYNYLKCLIEELPEYQIEGIKAVCEQIERFASNSVRNAASLGGNIVTASPISDLNPLWLAMDCSLNIMNSNGNIRIVPFNQFFLGYRKVNLLEDEIVISINIPLFNININNNINTNTTTSNTNTIDTNTNTSNDNNNNNDLIEIVHSYKQSKRREDDIAIVTSGMRMIIDKSNSIIKECKISFGGMSFKTILAEETSKYLIGKNILNENVFLQAIELLKQDVPLKDNAPGGMIEYRCSLTLSFLYKFYISCIKQCKLRELTQDELSILESQFVKPYPKGEQVYRPLKEYGTSVGKPIPHNYSHLQVTGEATYVQDIPPQSREAYAYPVLSTKPYARIKKVDYLRALTFEGVITWVDYKDVKGSNRCGAVIHDEEELFLTSETTSCGQLIGFIIADSHLKAMTAAKSVHVEYEEYHNPILSIQDALQYNAPSLIDRRIFRGDAISKLNEIKHLIKLSNTSNTSDNSNNTNSNNTSDNSNDEYEIIEGDLNIGGQEHFYFETQSCLILPGRYGMSGDEGEYVVFSSTQSPTHTQSIVASALGIPDHKVISKLKRLGGGFGGKESRSCILAGAVAVAAQKTNRPVRCILDRDVDMQSSGQRHPFYTKYQVVINKKTLKFETVLVDTYANGGYSLDYSKGVLERALYSFDNVYYFPHIDLKGKALKTNLPTNTAFRGFGGPQGLMMCEHLIEHVAHYLNVKYPNLINQFITNHLNQYNITKNVLNINTINTINTNTTSIDNNIDNNNNNNKSIDTNNIQLSHLIRQVNMYEKDNAITPYRMPIGDVHRIILMWDRIIEITKYQERLQLINEFNSKNKYQKRGLSLIPTKFAISFGVSFLNQASALLNIYSHDGSVYVSHAGTEMGQGVSIKVAQCVASSLGIPLELIHVGETSTDKVPNTSATAASVGSDLNGFAAKNACEKINQQLLPLKKILFPHLFNTNDTLNENGENNNEITTPSLTIEEWKKLVKEAYMKCLPLTATGYYKTPNLHMDWDKSEGTPFSYFTYGVACSEVQIDTLTGDWTCLKTDIVMDVGDSLNPTIDIGQIEGAFIQGMGYYTMEELIFGDKEHTWVQPGHLFTKGPGNYKIPSGNDIPNEFNVHLLRDEQNRQFPSSVFSSKGVGEPPLFLASSVLFAIRNAITDYRTRNCNNPSYFVLDSPCTCERIRMLCEDDFTKHFYNNKQNQQIGVEKNEQLVAFRAKGSF